jgi:hypothetical protein
MARPSGRSCGRRRGVFTPRLIRRTIRFMAVWQGKMVGNLARYDVVPDVYSARYGWNNNAPLYLPFCIQGGIFIRDFYSIGSSRYNKTAPSERFRFRNADINKSNSPKNATPGEPGRINQSFDWKPSPRNYDIVVDEARSEKFQ